MLASVLFAFVTMVFLGLLLARFAPRRAREGRLPPPVMRRLTLELVKSMGLDVIAEDEDVFVAIRKEPMGDSRYVVVLATSDVDQAGILAAAESVKGEGAVRGMLVTSGRIETAGLGGLDVALTLVDGPAFRALVARHLPERLPEVDRGLVATPA